MTYSDHELLGKLVYSAQTNPNTKSHCAGEIDRALPRRELRKTPQQNLISYLGSQNNALKDVAKNGDSEKRMPSDKRNSKENTPNTVLDSAINETTASNIAKGRQTLTVTFQMSYFA